MQLNNFYDLNRKQFRDRLDHLLHPSGNIFLPAQLKGREKPISQMRDCFETPGAHAFVWGPRGVGKTSLGHTACEFHKDLVQFAAAVSCTKDTDFDTIMNDIFRSVVQRNRVNLTDKKLSGELAAFGIKIGGEAGGIQPKFHLESPSHASAFLGTIFSLSRFPDRTPVVIVDEFDLLRNRATFEAISNMLKQLSVSGERLKFIFCGVARDLDELLGSHESVERYVYGVELRPLSHDALWEIITDVEAEFDIRFNRGQRMRVSQISAGYAHFTHLILKNVLLQAFEAKFQERDLTDDVYKSGIHESAQQAATRLKIAYENATKRGTDKYIEVLWAIANSEHLDRQFKDIQSDYLAVMRLRKDRTGYDAEKNNGQDLRNALNSLSERGILVKGKTGWYQFSDPMLRSYVRMVAEREGVELSDESFPR